MDSTIKILQSGQSAAKSDHNIHSVREDEILGGVAGLGEGNRGNTGAGAVASRGLAS